MADTLVKLTSKSSAMKKLNCVIVESELSKREHIRQMALKHPQLNLLCTFRNAIEAVHGINCREVDIAIIAADMPLRNGFQLIESLHNSPQIIVMAENTQHAIKAFDYNVTDFLCGPVKQDRFDAAITKAYARVEQNRQWVHEEPSIYVKHEHSKKRLVIQSIKWVEALGDYVKVITDKQNFILSMGLTKFLSLLPEHSFFRIHKSYAVNLHRIETYQEKKVWIDLIELPVSRNNKQAFEVALKQLHFQHDVG